MRESWQPWLCVCGEIETERHVLQDCKNYEKERKFWQEKRVLQMGNADQMSGLKGYLKCGRELDACSLVYMGRIWCIKEKNEAERESSECVSMYEVYW